MCDQLYVQIYSRHSIDSELADSFKKNLHLRFLDIRRTLNRIPQMPMAGTLFRRCQHHVKAGCRCPKASTDASQHPREKAIIIRTTKGRPQSVFGG